jgi:hypothetical protein
VPRPTTALREPPLHEHTFIEPFRIKWVGPPRFTTFEERRAALEAAGWNLFGLHADKVLIDMLTDSWTGSGRSSCSRIGPLLLERGAQVLAVDSPHDRRDEGSVADAHASARWPCPWLWRDPRRPEAGQKPGQGIVEPGGRGGLGLG